MICQTCRSALRAQRAPSMRFFSHLRPSTPTASILAHQISTSTTKRLQPQPQSATARLFSTSPQRLSTPLPSEEEEPSMSPAESAIASLLASKLEPTELLVQDISGGCGSMYAISITSPQFKGLSILKQQRLVTGALGDMVKQWHGVQIRTKVPPEN